VSTIKKPPKKAELFWETTHDGFLVPSGAVNPMEPKSRKWDLLDTPMGGRCNVAGGRWPGGKPR
jgi:hypothetical protein